ncbi:MAG: GNAT family N-acetyltransferase [Candidatus Hermodarchaeota archaeon]
MITQLRDKAIIYNHLKKDISLFAYHIADLDDLFFSDCTWYGLIEGEKVYEIILVYTGLSTPAVLALGKTPKMPVLLQGIIKHLPDQFFCHYQKELEKVFLLEYNRTYLGTHLKMDFQGFPNDISMNKTSECIQLTEEDEPELLVFFREAYPDNYYGSNMLATGRYYGVRLNDKLQSVAGVHVYSKEYRIAVLGNISTRPAMRSRGLAKQCITKLLGELVDEVDYIGLNVKADNEPAIKVYKSLGFKTNSEYEEAFFERIKKS